MRWAAAAWLVVCSGCTSPVLTAARITLTADAAIIEGERAFGEWDAEHQRQLASADLVRYRTAQRPAVVGGFTALTHAAHAARTAVELGQQGKLDPLPAAKGVCQAVQATAAATAAVGCQLAAVSIAAALCQELGR